MRVIFCYASAPNLICAAAISRFAPKVEFVKTEGLYGYGEAIASRWTGESDLVVVEGDKEIVAETFPSFSQCERDWCTSLCSAFPPPFTQDSDIGLACARFSAKLQQEISASEFLCEDVFWEPCRLCDNKGCWRQLDSRMARAFYSHKISQHVHGRVKHHHEYNDEWQREQQLNHEHRLKVFKTDPRFGLTTAEDEKWLRV